MPAHGRCPGPQMRREMRLRSRSSGRTARTDPASRAPSPDSPWPASAGIPSSSRKPNLLPCSPAAEGEPCLRWSSEPVQSFSAARAQRPSECLPAAVTPTEIIKERRKTGLTDGAAATLGGGRKRGGNGLRKKRGEPQRGKDSTSGLQNKNGSNVPSKHFRLNTRQLTGGWKCFYFFNQLYLIKEQEQ